jgi:digeranylgeranylglycerophospholipid reductase
METNLYNTIVIGAGPVGTYLADKLVRLGYKVLVLDKKSAPGQDVCCTGIISKDCLNLLPPGINLSKRTIRSASFVAPSGKLLRLSRNDDVAYIVDRVALEQELTAIAQADGACCIFNSDVIDLQHTEKCLIVSAKCQGINTKFHAQTVVITTGFGSPLPAKIGLGEIKNYIIGAQAEVCMSNIKDVEIYFDRTLGPGGFSWLVPMGDNLGLLGQLTYGQPKKHFKKLLAALRNHAKISTTDVSPDCRLIPLSPLPKTHSERLLVVGEAAGQVKPMTGGGIYYGFLCADIAVETLHRAFQAREFSETRLASYEKRWRARLGRELKIGYWAHRFYSMLGNRQIEGLHNLISRNGMPRLISEMDDFPFDWHSRLLLKTLSHLAVSIPALVINPLIKRKTSGCEK